jgi:hypothetical protein
MFSNFWTLIIYGILLQETNVSVNIIVLFSFQTARQRRPGSAAFDTTFQQGRQKRAK